MKQFLPTKSAEHEETPVRYSSSEISHLRPREVPTMLQTESAGTLWAMVLYIYLYIYVTCQKMSGIWLHLVIFWVFLGENRGEMNTSVDKHIS